MRKSKEGVLTFGIIVGIAFAIVILLVGGTITAKLWSILSSFQGNSLMILLMGIAVLFFWLMFRRRR